MSASFIPISLVQFHGIGSLKNKADTIKDPNRENSTIPLEPYDGVMFHMQYILCHPSSQRRNI